MHRLGRTLAFLLAFAILYAGPIAACVCADDLAMASMPCCPDLPDDPPSCDTGPATSSATCAAVSAKLLPVPPAQDIPAPLEFPAAWPDPGQAAPPPLRRVARIDRAAHLHFTPIYLVTQRLRH